MNNLEIIQNQKLGKIDRKTEIQINDNLEKSFQIMIDISIQKSNNLDLLN
jgi:hypothetical protein